MRIIFFGTPYFVIPVLEALMAHFQVVGVVTAPDKKVGRKQIVTPSQVAKYAQKHNIPVFTPEKLDQKFNHELQTTNPELFIVAAYGKLLPQHLMELPKFSSLNVHPSLLPKYRGPSPIQAAILNGDKVSGVSIIKMDDKMDHGLIVYAKEITLSSTDTFETLSKKMFFEGAKLLTEIIPDFINGKITPKEQNHNLATFTKIIEKEDGYFDINNLPSHEVLDRMFRAYYPWPSAWTKWEGKIVKFYPEGLVQMEGKKPTKLEDFLRGYPNFPIRNLL